MTMITATGVGIAIADNPAVTRIARADDWPTAARRRPAKPDRYTSRSSIRVNSTPPAPSVRLGSPAKAMMRDT